MFSLFFVVVEKFLVTPPPYCLRGVSHPPKTQPQVALCSPPAAFCGLWHPFLLPLQMAGPPSRDMAYHSPPGNVPLPGYNPIHDTLLTPPLSHTIPSSRAPFQALHVTLSQTPGQLPKRYHDQSES